jgi:peptide/nickel transport system substrate-binding protein
VLATPVPAVYHRREESSMATTPHKKVLRVGVLNEIHHWDPLAAQDTESMFVVKQVFASPYGSAIGSTEVEPVLFTGPLTQLSATRYRGRVRDDVLFSDGSPMTPQDVFDSLQATGIGQDVATLRLEGRDLHFELKRPDASFALTLAHGQCGVVRRQGDQLLGTGPFRIHPDSQPHDVLLVRNPHHKPLTKLDEVHFQTFPIDRDGKPEALLHAFERGELDLTTSLGRDYLERLSGVRKSILPGISTCFLYLNTDATTGTRLRDPLLRRAVAHAIDRLEIAKICYANPLAFAASSILPRTLGSGDDPLIFDPAKARQLLSQVASKPAHLELLLTWGPRAYLPDPRGVADAIARQLAAIGIEVRIRPTRSSADFFQHIIDGTHDMALAGWVADTMDPADFLESNLASYRVPTAENLAVSANDGRLRSPAMDELINAWRADQRGETLERILDLVGEEAPLVPLIYGASSTVWSYRTLNFKPSALAHYPLTQVDLS